MNRSLLALATSILVAGALGVSCADNEPDDSTPVIMGGNGGTGGTDETGGTGPGTGGEGLGGDGGQSDCAPSQTVCDSFCSSTGSDPLHCGTCDNECATGEGCMDGTCEDFGCSTGQVKCDGACTNLQTDRLRCGDCDTECGNGEVCDSGLCATSCASGRIECNGGCIDPMTDRMNCGADSCDSAAGGAGGAGSGVACADGEVCSAGSCTTSCPAGQLVCDNRCVEVSTNRDFCGATDCSAPATSGDKCDSGEVCSSGTCTTSCPSGQVVCGNRCIDPDTDRLFCGASDDCIGVNDGESCGDGTICSAGSCETSCPTNFLICNDKCVDPAINPNFCGATNCGPPATSGDTCESGEICASGACELRCPSGQVICGGKCVDPDTDPNFCGATLDCEGANSGEACGGGEYCVDEQCEPTCPLDYLVCGDKCVDPLGSDEFCGATDCGNVMTAGETCSTEESCVVGECRAFVFEWSSGVQVNAAGTTTDNFQVVGTDANGNTLVVWKQFGIPGDFTTLGLYARRYRFATKTWSNPVRVDVGVNEQVRNQHLVVAANGNAYVVWDTQDKIFGSAFVATTETWGAPIRVDSGTAATRETPEVAIDGSGNAWIVWSESVTFSAPNPDPGSTFRIIRRYFDFTTGTFPNLPEMIAGYGSPTKNPSYLPLVRMNLAGDVSMVWVDQNPDDPLLARTMFGTTKPNGGAWTSPEAVSGATIILGYGNPDLGIDSSGNSYAVWVERYGGPTRYGIAMRKRTVAGWGATTPLTDTALVERMRNPKIATDGSGNSVVTYYQGTYSNASVAPAPWPVVGPWPVYAARVATDLSFVTRLLRTVPNRTVPRGQEALIDPQVVLDSLGNSHVAWGNGADVETARFDVQRGSWGAYEVLASGTSGAVVDPDMSVAPGGRAFATWYQAGKAYFARFD